MHRYCSLEDIDRGGIFAALLGTLMLLEPMDRACVKGLIVNKFRGDLALWRDGERLLAERAALPVVGTVPYFQDIHIAEEDSVPLEQGSALLGICGGYQMLGERVSDPAGIEGEAGVVEHGLDLLPVETIFTALENKILRQCSVQISPMATRGLFAALAAQTLQAYQIHVGRTREVRDEHHTRQGEQVFLVSDTQSDGYMREDGWVMGCYLHGLFENRIFRDGVVHALAERRLGAGGADQIGRGLVLDREREYDKLAQVLRASLNLVQLREICGLG